MRYSIGTAPLPLALLTAGLLAAGAPCRGAHGLVANDDLIFVDGFELLYLLEVTNTGGGIGIVTSDSGGIDCGTTCSALFRDGSSVILQARTTNGSGSSFTNWSGDCSGSYRDCALTMTAARSATATIASQTHNLAFVTSATYAMNLGSAITYDAQCNAAATSAGINNASSNAFAAWVSSFSSLAVLRLGSARGWVRLDGEPFADVLSDVLIANKVFNAIDRDEFGATVIAQNVLTGTASDGSAGASCSDWTTTSGALGKGNSSGGPVSWTEFGTMSCSQSARIYCLMKTMNTALVLPVPPPGSRKLWITSNGYVPGSAATPDQTCNLDRPSGVASAKAVIATTGAAAVNALGLDETYVRLDGQIVGAAQRSQRPRFEPESGRHPAAPTWAQQSMSGPSGPEMRAT